MAQLRDSRTSQILHEGTPLECVTIARQLGLDNVLFDDVGAVFDPDAVWQASQEQQDALARVAQGDSSDSARAQASLDAITEIISAAQAQAEDVAQRQVAIRAGDQVSPIS